MIRFLVSLVIGALVGGIAAKIMGQEKQGCLRNILLGLLGSAVGGLIGGLLHFGNGWLASLILSVIGACLVLFIIEKLKK